VGVNFCAFSFYLMNDEFGGQRMQNELLPEYSRPAVLLHQPIRFETSQSWNAAGCMDKGVIPGPPGNGNGGPPGGAPPHNGGCPPGLTVREKNNKGKS
jgi:hypothetical protein